MTYYIYELVDPRTNQPFYIGKGKGKRAESHLLGTSNTPNPRKESKINKIRSLGLEPIIRYLLEGIEDETLAYKLEEEFILKYGRKGFEQHGVLTNICIGNKPPVLFGDNNPSKRKDVREKHRINGIKQMSSPEARKKASDTMKLTRAQHPEHWREKNPEAWKKLQEIMKGPTSPGNTQEARRKKSETVKALGPRSIAVKEKISQTKMGKRYDKTMCPHCMKDISINSIKRHIQKIHKGAV